MDPALAVGLTVLVGTLIVAAAAVVVARSALNNTDSEDRAGVLHAVADIIRAVRGKR